VATCTRGKSLKRILLVEPAFPIPTKSRNHSAFLPIGLLKIAAWKRNGGDDVRLQRGAPRDQAAAAELQAFDPDEVWITSLFTYWAQYVRDAVQVYRGLLPNAKIVVGGIYASLQSVSQVKEYLQCDEVRQGVIPEAELHYPAYDLVQNSNSHPIDYQILHASRGCKRKCRFCGTWKIEPAFVPERGLAGRIQMRKLVFYDNNFLMNPHAEDILEELVELRTQGKITWCESQSGFDGRILIRRPYLAKLIRQAGFRYPRIAWDGSYEEHRSIERQLQLLRDAGYESSETYVFMIYNWDFPFEEMEEKRIACWNWKVQIADCRFRPLDQLFDRYIPGKFGQTSLDYHIHSNWTDAEVKQFRRNVRAQNICVRHGFPLYSKDLERKKVGKELIQVLRGTHSLSGQIAYLDSIGADHWVPSEVRYPASETTLQDSSPKSTVATQTCVSEGRGA
jgi:hypothetical protein